MGEFMTNEQFRQKAKAWHHRMRMCRLLTIYVNHALKEELAAFGLECIIKP